MKKGLQVEGGTQGTSKGQECPLPECWKFSKRNFKEVVTAELGLKGEAEERMARKGLQAEGTVERRCRHSVTQEVCFELLLCVKAHL